jgi:helix-turn-helix protein
MDDVTYATPALDDQTVSLWGRLTVDLGLHIPIRRGAGLTQAELADQLGTTLRTISAWETKEHRPGHFALPYYSALVALTRKHAVRS